MGIISVPHIHVRRASIDWELAGQAEESWKAWTPALQAPPVRSPAKERRATPLDTADGEVTPLPTSPSSSSVDPTQGWQKSTTVTLVKCGQPTETLCPKGKAWATTGHFLLWSLQNGASGQFILNWLAVLQLFPVLSVEGGAWALGAFQEQHNAMNEMISQEALAVGPGRPTPETHDIRLMCLQEKTVQLGADGPVSDSGTPRDSRLQAHGPP